MKHSPTLLQINLSANVGSHGRIAEEIGLAAMKLGWRSVIAYGRSANASQSELIRVGSNIDIYEHLVETRLFDNHGLASRLATKRFIEKVKELKPDIIHLHNIHGYYLNYKLLFEYLNSTNIPVVWTLHDCWAFSGHCGHFIMAGCEKWKTGCGHCPITRTEYPTAYVDRSARNYELKSRLFGANKNLHIITVSKWLAGIVHESILKEKRIQVINNGIDLNVFRPIIAPSENRIKIEGSFVILGVASTWSEIKGIDDYIKLSHLLSENEKLVLLGVNEDLKEKMPKNIICLPRTESTKDLAEWYNRADVLLSLSKGETFGMTIAEAMACGTPAIVYDNTAQPELISEGCGYIVPTSNIDKVYERILNVKEIGKKNFSDACRRRVEQNYNKEDRYQDYIELYKELLNEK